MPLRLSDLPIKTGHLFIGLAILMSIVTVVMFASGKKSEPKKPVVQAVETRSIVVPTMQVLQGETLSMDNLTVVEWPKAFLPKYDVFNKTSDLVGRVARQDLMPGEPIFRQKIAGADAAGLPAMIPVGRRAVTVAVSEVKGVAGFVKPGDRVDLLTTFEVADKTSSSGTLHITKTVLQNVQVLASAQAMVDESTERTTETPEGVTQGSATLKQEEDDGDNKDKKKKEKDKKEPTSAELEKERKAKQKEKLAAEKRAKLVSSVTLALTPEEAEKVALAEETGVIRLSLRSEADYGVESVQGVEFEQLLGFSTRDKKPDAAPPPEPPRFSAVPRRASVEVIQGTEKTSVEF